MQIDPDPVRWPAHYNQGGIECIDAMIQAFGEDDVKVFCRLNAFKYLWRHKEKGSLDNDVAKAIWYLRFSNGDDPRNDDRR